MKSIAVLLVLGALIAVCRAEAEADSGLLRQNFTAVPRCSGCFDDIDCGNILGRWFWRSELVSGSDAYDNEDTQKGAGVGLLDVFSDCSVDIEGYAQPLLGATAKVFPSSETEVVYFSKNGRRFKIGEPAFLNCQIVTPHSEFWCVGYALFNTGGARDVYKWTFVRGTSP